MDSGDEDLMKAYIAAYAGEYHDLYCYTRCCLIVVACRLTLARVAAGGRGKLAYSTRMCAPAPR